MPAIESSWLVGEIGFASPVEFTASGDTCYLAPGSYYLWDANPNLSLPHQIVAAVEASEIIGPGTLTAIVRRDRKVQFDYAGGIMSLQFPAVLATAIGFATTLYEDLASFVGTAVPALLWSPGWPETPIGHPVGTAGYEVPQVEQTSSSSGLTIRTTVHGTAARLTELYWAQVQRARVWTTDDGEPGEYRRFWREVIVPGRRWKLYSGITEDAASSSAVTWTPALGPYKGRDIDPRWWNRAIQQVDSHTNITLKGTRTGEIDNG